jgi:hypothetical protein
LGQSLHRRSARHNDLGSSQDFSGRHSPETALVNFDYSVDGKLRCLSYQGCVMKASIITSLADLDCLGLNIKFAQSFTGNLLYFGKLGSRFRFYRRSLNLNKLIL